MQYFWISEKVFKKSLQFSLKNMLIISDERARKATSTKKNTP